MPSQWSCCLTLCPTVCIVLYCAVTTVLRKWPRHSAGKLSRDYVIRNNCRAEGCEHNCASEGSAHLSEYIFHFCEKSQAIVCLPRNARPRCVCTDAQETINRATMRLRLENRGDLGKKGAWRKKEREKPSEGGRVVITSKVRAEQKRKKKDQRPNLKG